MKQSIVGSLVVLSSITIFFASCSPEKKEKLELDAVAMLYSISEIKDGEFDLSDKEIGMASFAQNGEIVTLEITLFGMPPNSSKAVHIHEGTITQPKSHWNQLSLDPFCQELSLGSPWDKPYAGDVGNVEIDSNGNGKLVLTTDIWSLDNEDKVKNIIDKVILVHQNEQDFSQECKPNHPHMMGHNNKKIGGGTILAK